VLLCLTTGMSVGDIAEHLFLSRHTVQTHVKGIYRKLGVRNRGHAVAEAIRLNIIQLKTEEAMKLWKVREYEAKCGNQEAHEYHSFIDMHFKEKWCSGICEWCYPRRIHSAGDHK
jgi:predicted transcriptional regulator